MCDSKLSNIYKEKDNLKRNHLSIASCCENNRKTPW